MTMSKAEVLRMIFKRMEKNKDLGISNRGEEMYVVPLTLNEYLRIKTLVDRLNKKKIIRNPEEVKGLADMSLEDFLEDD